MGARKQSKFQVGDVRGYFEGEKLYIETPYGSSDEEFLAALAWVRDKGYEPGPQGSDEETEDGLRIPCHRIRKPVGGLV